WRCKGTSSLLLVVTGQYQASQPCSLSSKVDVPVVKFCLLLSRDTYTHLTLPDLRKESQVDRDRQRQTRSKIYTHTYTHNTKGYTGVAGYSTHSIMFGGSTGADPMYSNNTYIYSFETNKMVHQPTTGDVPNPRSAHSAICYNDHMYIFGGWDGKESNNDTYKLNLKTFQWRKMLNSNPPLKRRAHCCVLYNKAQYLFGGFDTAYAPETFNTIHKFCFKKEKWTTVTCDGEIPKGRSRASMVQFENKFYMIGGWDRKNYFHEIYEFNIESFHWKKMMHNINQVNLGLGQNSVLVHANRMFVFAGYQPKKNSSTNELFMSRLS
ncbi:hypothetical protein SAMD00019534_106590, partial [Acytostelium subglobosum LB1]|uniref:hypothetical protein n=1 Tax=Acytostelium subglobosum LB1 TaxID=1410327 RepID=UPI0006451EA8